MDAKLIANAHLSPSACPTSHYRRHLLLSFLLLSNGLLVSGIAPTACGQTSDSSPTWWNPTTWGSSDDSVRKSSYFSNTETQSEGKPWLSMPQFPWSSAKKKPSSAEPSLMHKMGQSTKRAWNNTVDFLNPFEDEPPEPQQQGYQPQNKTSKPGSGMFGWMWREETTETPASVNEFLRQERPKF